MRTNRDETVIKNGCHYIHESEAKLSLTTPVGTILYIQNREHIEDIFKELLIRSSTDIGNDLSQKEETEQVLKSIFPFYKIKIDLGNPQFIDEVNYMVNTAIDYLENNLGLMLQESIWGFLDEALIKAILSSEINKESAFSISCTETEAFNFFIAQRAKLIKKRLRIKKKSGQPLYWTGERKVKLVTLYAKYFPLTKAAKSTFRKLKSANWVEMIRAGYPDLPTEIIKKLDRYGQDGEPSRIVLDYLAGLFDNASPEYMLRKIAEIKLHKS